METTTRTRFLSGVALAMGTSALALACWDVAITFSHTDFPVLYRAGRLVLLTGEAGRALYDPVMLQTIPVPEPMSPAIAMGRFVWPVSAAWPLAGLALLPYYPAKALMVFLNVVGYLLAIQMLLAGLGTPPRRRWAITCLFMLWPPFLYTLLYGQVNAVLLLLLVVAATAARHGHTLGVGLAIAGAAVFKVFPVAAGMFLVFWNWRHGVAGILLFGLLLVDQPMQPWLDSMARGFSTHRAMLGQVANVPFPIEVLYSAGVGSIGLWGAYRRAQPDPEWLLAVGVTTALLASPVFEYYHLTFLVLPYACLIGPARTSRLASIAALLSAIIIVAAIPRVGVFPSWASWWGILAAWLGLLMSSNRPPAHARVVP